MSSNDDTRHHQTVLFEGEMFVIGGLQTLSATETTAVLSQVDTLIKVLSVNAFKIILVGFILCLILTTASSYLRWYYKLWDLKSDNGTGEKFKRRDFALSAYRKSLFAAMVSIYLTLFFLIGAVTSYSPSP